VAPKSESWTGIVASEEGLGYIAGMNSEPIYLSKDGRIKMEQELRQLKYEQRPKLVAEIKRAKELGDLSENAEYHAAKESQVHLERKIAELEDKLTRVRSVDVDQIPSDKVYLFAKVLVRDLDRGEEIEYTVAPPDESDVDKDIISVKSPIGAGLLGKAVGDTTVIQVPVGVIRYEILKISRE
jgi:transcription elongation factor GreA